MKTAAPQYATLFQAAAPRSYSSLSHKPLLENMPMWYHCLLLFLFDLQCQVYLLEFVAQHHPPQYSS
uniref:Aspartic proteinase Asp1 n=1 Tax=Rhizophora mucronata TaxID=61149 RepID=A0A2P2KCD3_RHIMU